MALETGTYINSLNAANPVATDGLAQADDHLRLIKSTITATFPNITGEVSATQVELNKLDGATVSTTELNVIDGDTAATSTTLVDADRVVVNDDGTMKQVAISDLSTYMSGKLFKNSSGTWTIEPSGTSLLFKFDGTSKMKLESNGSLTVTGDITAYGTI